jgi:hypothetical protein
MSGKVFTVANFEFSLLYARYICGIKLIALS